MYNSIFSISVILIFSIMNIKRCLPWNFFGLNVWVCLYVEKFLKYGHFKELHKLHTGESVLSQVASNSHKEYLFDISFTISFWPNQIWLILIQHVTTATHELLTSSNKGIIQMLQKDWGPLSIFASYINILQCTLRHGCFTYVTFEEYLTEWKLKHILFSLWKFSSPRLTE